MINVYVYCLEITTAGKKMRCCFSLKERRIKIFNQTPPGEKFNYLRTEGVINFTIDRKYNVPLIEIQFEGWFENSVRLWPKDNKARENLLLLERTLPPTPSISSPSGIGIDTIFLLYKRTWLKTLK